MRKAITALALIMLAGCTTSGLEKDQPAFAGQSQKTPKQLAQCIGPKWQAYNSSTSSIETESGYRIAASADLTGVVALAVIDKAQSGSTVRVFLPMDWAATSAWKDAAKACI
ncbi:hypothetical protein [Pseudomonas moorei]|uniref:Lipoprotein n=1 Tax=Pseudomonas moorei TaxID=395599 RepID=A0A1H1FHI7_9PSED|nr:hypothetical protein [Pseudomonas moorei]KAB0509692.1 hypothetical protein F7R06_01335 [Pseudomonas moorei]SDR00294.1 hypothetical protein SAMN04490195_2705 [Pseudomonas moorei]